MEDIFKKFLYTSVGFASLAKDKMVKLVEELKAEGKMSEEEGEKIINKFKNLSDEQKKDFDGKMRDFIDKAVDNLNFVNNDEIEKLKNRIDILEKLLKKDKDEEKKEEAKKEEKKEEEPTPKDDQPDNPTNDE